jgi:hypothetical protein
VTVLRRPSDAPPAEEEIVVPPPAPPRPPPPRQAPPPRLFPQPAQAARQEIELPAQSSPITPPPRPRDPERTLSRGGRPVRLVRLASERPEPQPEPEPPPIELPAPQQAFGLGGSYDARLRELVDEFASDLVPLLQAAMVESIRVALASGASTARARAEGMHDVGTYVEGALRETMQSGRIRLRRHRRSGQGIRERALAMIAETPGVTTQALAQELYGNDEPTARAKVRSLAWKLEREGLLRRVSAGSYALV